MTLKLVQLTEVLNILDLLYQRNKNQHRVTKWWKWFSMLRRSVSKLLRELSLVVPGVQASARLIYMQDVLLPRCYLYVSRRALLGLMLRLIVYRAFGQLVTDTQFAALGLLLLSTLAKIHSIIGTPIRLHSQSILKRLQTPVPGMSADPDEDLGKLVRRSSPDAEAKNSQCPVTTTESNMRLDDVGDDCIATRNPCSPTDLSLTRTVSLAPDIQPKRKKAKRRNAIDDLFSAFD